MHGFVNSFRNKTNKTNIPELINNIRIKTGDYSSKLFHLPYEEETDKKINNIEYDYSDDILKLNDDIKMKLRLKFN